MNFKRGTLKAFDAGTYKASVLLEGGLSAYLTSVPVSRAIAAVEMVADRKVGILFFDDANPDDCVITAVWT